MSYTPLRTPFINMSFGVVPSLSMKSVQRCEQCSGTGKEGNTPLPADEPVAE